MAVIVNTAVRVPQEVIQLREKYNIVSGSNIDKLKFDEHTILQIKLNLMAHSNYTVKQLHKSNRLTGITKWYLAKCNELLVNYDPVNIEQNLKKMNII